MQKVNQILAALQADPVTMDAEFHVYLHDGTEVVNYTLSYEGPQQVTLPSAGVIPAKFSLNLGAS